MATNRPPHPRLAELNAKLSTSQSNSFGLLLEWWSGDCQEKELSDTARLSIHTEAGLGNISVSDTMDPMILEYLQTGPNAERLLVNPRIGDSVYHGVCFKLFLYEFFYYEGLDTKYLSTLQHHRQKCATLAACQRISYSCFKSFLEDAITPSAATSESGDSMFGNASPKHSNIHMAASIEPCPWLNLGRDTWSKNDETGKGLPYYLWDCKGRCTVEVTTLPEHPQYVVISHTWGRWVKESKKDHPPVCITGVPWRVPQNTRFEVESLPDILQKVPFNVPYVWMDLLCIPQESADPNTMNIARDEIARQAQIFHQAACGAVWLNDIGSWDGLQSTIEWLALKFFIQSSNLHQRFEEYENAAFEAADIPTGFYQDYEYGTDPSTEGVECSGWFSSLWTLQEAFLRPHMWLFNKDWKALGIGDGTPVSLDALFALVQGFTDLQLNKVSSLQNRGNRSSLEAQFKDLDFPRGFIELSGLCWTTGLDQLLDASPLTPLILGCQRYCRSGRAKAIMSVIGATDWFTNSAASITQFDDTPEPDLVLGRFPLPFLNEVKDKLGPLFFSSCLTEVDDLVGLRQQDVTAANIQGVGSLLPFGPNAELIRFRSRWQSADLQAHPSISSWDIQQDGSVQIAAVGIVASTLEIYDGNEIAARVMAPLSYGSVGKGANMYETSNLHKWIREYCVGRTSYAVCLFYGSGYNEGIILEEISGEGTVLVKTGNYFLADGAKCPEPRFWEVDWRVL
jgi:hypothetical protein